MKTFHFITLSLGGCSCPALLACEGPVGTLAFDFSDCRQGQMAYRIDIDGRQGTMPLQRLIPGSDNDCQDQMGGAAIAAAAVDINAGMDVAWVNSDTLGQRFLIDVHPDPQGDNFTLVAWFAYANDTEFGQRWLTAQGDFAGSTAAIDMYETIGGLFDDLTQPERTGPDLKLVFSTVRRTGPRRIHDR